MSCKACFTSGFCSMSSPQAEATWSADELRVMCLGWGQLGLGHGCGRQHLPLNSLMALKGFENLFVYCLVVISAPTAKARNGCRYYCNWEQSNHDFSGGWVMLSISESIVFVGFFILWLCVNDCKWNRSSSSSGTKHLGTVYFVCSKRPWNNGM